MQAREWCARNRILGIEWTWRLNNLRLCEAEGFGHTGFFSPLGGWMEQIDKLDISDSSLLSNKVYWMFSVYTVAILYVCLLVRTRR